MSKIHEPLRTPATTPSSAWTGWVTFAAIVLSLIGSLAIVQGLVALFDEGYFLVRTDDDLLALNFTTWGLIQCFWGALLIGAGFGLIKARGWARWFAIAVVFVNVIVQIGFLAAYPIWSALMILLDVLVIFALTARWDEARSAMR